MGNPSLRLSNVLYNFLQDNTVNGDLDQYKIGVPIVYNFKVTVGANVS